MPATVKTASSGNKEIIDFHYQQTGTNAAGRKNMEKVLYRKGAVDELVWARTVPAGVEWTLQTTPEGAWNSVCYGNGLFVAVGKGTANNNVMTSSDRGITWTTQQDPSPGYIYEWTDITYANDTFYMLGREGVQDVIATSSNGFTWNVMPFPSGGMFPTPNIGIKIKMAVANNTLVIVGSQGIITRPVNDTVWTLQPTPFPVSWTNVIWDGLSGFVAVARNSDRSIRSDNLGKNWVQSSLIPTGVKTLMGLVALPKSSPLSTQIVAVGANTVLTGNSMNWNLCVSPVNNQWSSVTHGDGLFVAVSVTGTNNRAMTSPDGITWTARTTPANNAWRDVAYGDGVFVAVADSGTGNRVMTSP